MDSQINYESEIFKLMPFRKLIPNVSRFQGKANVFNNCLFIQVRDNPFLISGYGTEDKHKIIKRDFLKWNHYFHIGRKEN